MISRFVLFVSLLSLIPHAFGQLTDLREFGYKGPVESVTTLVYTRWSEDLIPDSTACNQRSYRHLNTQGMVDYLNSTYYNLYITEGEAHTTMSNLSFSFDSTGVKTAGSGITTQLIGDSTVSVSDQSYTFEYIDQYTYVQRSFDRYTGSKNGEQWIHVNDSAFITSSRYDGFDADTVEFSYETAFQTNERGQIQSSMETNSFDSSIVYQHYAYKAYDAWGNPVVLLVTTQDGSYENAVLMLKYYTYYSNTEKD